MGFRWPCLPCGLALSWCVSSSRGTRVVFPELVGPDELDVGYGEAVTEIDAEEPTIVVKTNQTHVPGAGVPDS